MQKVYVNKETKRVIGICEETMNITSINEFVNVSETDLLTLRGRAPDDEYYIINGELIKQENPKKVLNKQIIELKKQLQKYKEDVEQVELFGMDRDDYEQKKELCKNIILELRKLENRIKEMDNASENNQPS